jgi:hypothetical protein
MQLRESAAGTAAHLRPLRTVRLYVLAGVSTRVVALHDGQHATPRAPVHAFRDGLPAKSASVRWVNAYFSQQGCCDNCWRSGSPVGRTTARRHAACTSR